MRNPARTVEWLRRQRAERLARAVAAKHGLSLEELLGDGRSLSRCRAWRELVGLVTWTLGLSTVEAGAGFGRDHSTIAHCLTRREAELR